MLSPLTTSSGQLAFGHGLLGLETKLHFMAKLIFKYEVVIYYTRFPVFAPLLTAVSIP